MALNYTANMWKGYNYARRIGVCMATSESWTDPNSCPFCGAHLASPGAGFVDHIDESAPCKTEFEFWRENVGSDITAGWGG